MGKCPPMAVPLSDFWNKSTWLQIIQQSKYLSKWHSSSVCATVKLCVVCFSVRLCAWFFYLIILMALPNRCMPAQRKYRWLDYCRIEFSVCFFQWHLQILLINTACSSATPSSPPPMLPITRFFLYDACTEIAEADIYHCKKETLLFIP